MNLTQLVNIHHHKLRKQKILQEELFNSYIQQLPPYCSYQQVKHLTISRFGFSKRRFYYLLDKLNKNKSFEEVLQYLRSKQWKCRYTSNDGVPDIFLAASPQMCRAYTKWGDFVSFDLTYNLLRERSSQKKQWGVGLFVGFDSGLRIILLGVCLMSRERT